MMMSKIQNMMRMAMRNSAMMMSMMIAHDDAQKGGYASAAHALAFTVISAQDNNIQIGNAVAIFCSKMLVSVS